MGMVTVNGKIVTQMGYKINLNDKIRYDGQIIQAEKPEYFILNKPKGFIADLKKKKNH
jgi:23S rRNA pseudouridine2605 synthase